MSEYASFSTYVSTKCITHFSWCISHSFGYSVLKNWVLSVVQMVLSNYSRIYLWIYGFFLFLVALNRLFYGAFCLKLFLNFFRFLDHNCRQIFRATYAGSIRCRQKLKISFLFTCLSQFFIFLDNAAVKQLRYRLIHHLNYASNFILVVLTSCLKHEKRAMQWNFAE